METRSQWNPRFFLEAGTWTPSVSGQFVRSREDVLKEIGCRSRQESFGHVSHLRTSTKRIPGSKRARNSMAPAPGTDPTKTRSGTQPKYCVPRQCRPDQTTFMAEISSQYTIAYLEGLLLDNGCWKSRGNEQINSV